jgi:hypothetical protein
MWNMSIQNSVDNDVWNRAAWLLVAFFGIGLSLAIGFLASTKAFDAAPYTTESNPF